jgi:hypothetical protein
MGKKAITDLIESTKEDPMLKDDVGIKIWIDILENGIKNKVSQIAPYDRYFVKQFQRCIDLRKRGVVKVRT